MFVWFVMLIDIGGIVIYIGDYCNMFVVLGRLYNIPRTQHMYSGSDQSTGILIIRHFRGP